MNFKRTSAVSLTYSLFIGLALQVVDVASASAASEIAPAPASNMTLVLKYDWTLTTTGGGGGALGVQFDQMEVGVMGFATPLPSAFRDTFLAGAQNYDVTMNWGAEAYFQWYAAPSRRGLFVGGLISFDSFALRQTDSRSSEKLLALYMAPRLGLRLPLWSDRIYFEPAVAAAIRLWDSSLGDDDATIRAQPVAPLTFLTLGASFDL